MTDLTRAPSLSLLERTRDLATMSEPELRRLAAEAARDRDAEALWALTEAHLTLHGSAGSRVSLHTLTAYRRGLNDLLGAWQGENLLRPRRNAGVVYVRELEGRLKPASVGVKLAVPRPSTPPSDGRVRLTPLRLPTSGLPSIKPPRGSSVTRILRPRCTGSSARMRLTPYIWCS